MIYRVIRTVSIIVQADSRDDAVVRCAERDDGDWSGLGMGNVVVEELPETTDKEMIDVRA